jgi:serine/threonine-protein kinase ATR
VLTVLLCCVLFCSRCGLIEWVPNTTGFRHLVRATHDEEGVLTCFTTIKRLYEEHNAIVPSDIANEIRLYHRLCDLYRPVFHKW